MSLKNIFFALVFPAMGPIILSCTGHGGKQVVHDAAAFNAAVKTLEPGDTLVLAGGTWQDARLVFEGSGTAEKPIVVMAEEPGKVKLEGESSLALAGEHLVVSGLYFTNGHTPGEAVIMFRKDRDHLANRCRVTNCVIDSYNPQDRFRQDCWIMLYGKNNRVDHNYLGGKLNAGVTLIVQLNDERNQQNSHRIDHNFFGYRAPLGSNGGETIRVGVSTFSLTSSNTLIEENYFHRCNGEVEIVSVKSCDNILRNNTFYECEGGLVLRHGNRNIVEGNYFIGNGKPNTGGIRVINAGHRIRRNFFQDLKGGRFHAALPVMNGVPNSMISRYHQVKDVRIEDNTFVNCDNITFCIGSDNERTAVPVNTVVANNLFYHPQQDEVFTALDDISGVTFSDNKVVTRSGKFRFRGFTETDLVLTKNPDGLWHSAAAGLTPALPVTADSAGPGWFTRPSYAPAAFGSGRVTGVRRAPGGLEQAVRASLPGDVIELLDTGVYALSNTIAVRHPLTIRKKSGLAGRPVLIVAGNEAGYSFFSIESGGSLALQGLTFNGTSDGGVADNAIRTSDRSMIRHYNLVVDDCSFLGFNESRQNVFLASAGTFADTIIFSNSIFHDISGIAISLAAEKEDRGRYNAEIVNFVNCIFTKVMSGAVDIYRGGNDESTTGPRVTVDHCVFDNVNNNELGSTLRLMGVQWAEIKNSVFTHCGQGGRTVLFEDPRWVYNKVHHCSLFSSGRVQSFYDKAIGAGMMKADPGFTDPAAMNYELKPGSPLHGKADDGKNIGCVYREGRLWMP